MSALYLMRFAGRADTGAGTIYVGRGKVLGADVGDLRYRGTYVEQGGRIKGTVTLSSPRGGMLVTGQMLPANQAVTLTIDWPSNFWSGQQKLLVEGKPVNVVFEKLGDVP